ncbi:MAG TPA: hemerythrin [Thauera sp.]|nr:hemerythrin [Thauera sp.]
MDDTHREFVSLVDALLTVEDAQLAAALDAFAAHAEAHFEQENRWMDVDGFPARDCHVDEHAKVLASVREVQQLLAEGKVEVVRELAVALKDWFPGHADYMDSALALWMVKRSHGGAPLVFRRESAKSS